MTICTMSEYNKDLRDFLNKHENINECTFVEGETIRKMFCSEDGKTFYEVSRPVYETATVDVKGIAITVDVKLFETEWWSDDNSKSKYMYAKY